VICALTVRTLKPGTFDDFREAFMGGMKEDSPPEGWVRFDMIRHAEKPEEVICFGFFDSDSVDELRRASAEHGYQEQLDRIAPYVESVGTDGLYEVVESLAV
jgi:heme-degrading monooxygenase HmoA